ncbi:MAG: protein phosphatase 2C domain-containing protein [Chloroflexi bacterium]|nr:protein phosphatase 2C domain-containing protein [Chloroflexota bacterium]
MSKTGSQTKPFKLGELSHPGETGKNNEDRYGVMTIPVSDNQSGKLVVAVVADGIGGQNAGEEAADLAVKTVKDYFVERRSAADIPEALAIALQQVNGRIYERAQRNEMFHGMGTTATVAVISDNQLHVANVGDSRTYLIRKDTITQITVDHSWAQEAIEAKRLSVEEARRHPNRNVLKRYLGITAHTDVDLRIRQPGAAPDQWDLFVAAPLPLETGDTLLLCSDGLTDLVSDNEVRAAVAKYPPQHAADQLVQMARTRGGHDNITVLILQFGERKLARAAFPLPIVAGILGVLILAALAAVLLTRGGGASPTPTAGVLLTPVATLKPAVETVAPPTSTPPPVRTAPVAAGAPTEVPAATPTPVPLSTAVPTRTAAPSPSPASTLAPQTTAGPVATAGGVRGSNAPILLEPASGSTRTGRIRFSWQPQGALPDDAYYEVVWWSTTEAPENAHGLEAATRLTSVDIDLDALYGRQLIGAEGSWTVIIVQISPTYARLTLPPGNAHRLTYTPPSGGGEAPPPPPK